MTWIESDVPVYLTAIFGSLTTRVFPNVPPQLVPETFQPDMGIAQIGVTPPLAILGPGQAQQVTLTQGAVAAGVPVWVVNGQPGGNTQTGTISEGGLYTPPAVLPAALPVTITVAADNQTAGASVDVQTKTVLVGGLGIVQSVAYLAGLERLYTSGLSFGASPVQPGGDMGNPAVLIAERDGGQGQVSEVEVVGRYESDIIPINPPHLNPCLGTVNIVDPDLEAAIRASLPGQGPQGISVGPITCQAALTLKILFVDFFNIETLESLQAFQNLEEAFFFVNSIQDGSPLAELYRLFHLDIGSNELTDVEFLAKLTVMRRLYIADNLLSDTGLMKGASSDGQSAPQGLVTPILNPLVNLVHLEFILLGFNNIVDLSPLDQITDISVVSEWPHLFSLFVGGNPIGDLSPFSTKAGLLLLGVQELGISSLDFLAPLTGLLILALDDNEISDLSLLPNFSALLDLDLSSNPIADFTPIGSLSNLVQSRPCRYGPGRCPAGLWSSLRKWRARLSHQSDCTPGLVT